MADDIDIIDAAKVPTKRKKRWHHIELHRPLGGKKGIYALGETVLLNADGDPVDEPRRDGSLDLRIEYDKQNPDHKALFDLIDKIVMDAHKAAKAAAQQEPPAGAP